MLDQFIDRSNNQSINQSINRYKNYPFTYLLTPDKKMLLHVRLLTEYAARFHPKKRRRRVPTWYAAIRLVAKRLRRWQ